MRIAILGASGKSGKFILRKFLENGHDVKALVRNPNSLLDFNKYQNLKLIKGNALNENDINKTIIDTDVVISALGHKIDSPPDLQTRSITMVIKVMRHYGIKRIICLTGSGIFLDGDKPRLVDRILTKTLALIDPHRIKDGIEMVKRLLASDLDWTIVRTPLQHSFSSTDNRAIGLLGSKGQTLKCSRNFIADFIYECAINPGYIRQYPVISD